MPAQKPRSRARSTRTADETPRRGEGNGAEPLLPQQGDGEFTGRYIVTFQEGAEQAAMSFLSDSAGIAAASILRASDFADSVDASVLQDAGTVLFDQLGIAVVSAPPDAMMALNVAAAESDASPILAVEPERYLHILQDVHPPFEESAVPPPVPEDGSSYDTLNYLRGYRDSVVHLYEQLSGRGAGAAVEAGVAATFADNTLLTWGLQATGVDRSRFSGRGIRVAILDTGIDLQHPDFTGRAMTTRSLIPGVPTAQDGHGHGTHCVGTACGPLRPSNGRRYGIAHNAHIFVGKVLNDAGIGREGDIIDGMNWAVANGCHVVSMSLGADAPLSTAYEMAGRRSLAAGTLVVAAAGNDSSRSQGSTRPVSRPANSVSILAVAAIDRFGRIADFSNRGTQTGGGKVDIAGPGVAVYSSWRMPQRNRTISGTSMATPHVAGIAALWAEARGVRGAALGQLLNATVRPLSISSLDVGSGLVQAP